MLRTYLIPPDVNEKEKIFGGYLNLNQFFWILGGFLLGAVVFVLLFPLLNKFSLIPAGITIFSGVPFAIVKIKELTLFEYLKRKRAFNKKTKHLPNIKKDFSW